MRGLGSLLVLLVGVSTPGLARHQLSICGTHPELWKEQAFLHRQNLRVRSALRRGFGTLQAAAPAYALRPDAGNIAILEDADGVVARPNSFSLDGRTVALVPTTLDTSRYSYQTAPGGYDAAAAASGSELTGIGDDDARLLDLPFPFPFFGATYRQVWINSDGNLTFNEADTASTDRSFGRLTAGPPRIAPLFEDLDPTQAPGAIRVSADANRVVMSWVSVEEYSDYGTGERRTFQVRLYPGGRIEFAYSSNRNAAAVVGIGPGLLRGSSVLVDFASPSNDEYSSTVAEIFTVTEAIDVTVAAQRFYENHEDAYDYLVFYNAESIGAAPSAVSWESTVRNHRSGYGDKPIEIGLQYGSSARLQAVLNMGPLSQYMDTSGGAYRRLPPDGIVPLRRSSQDTPTTVLAHEAGHLFLAYASVRDPENPAARPMLGFQNAHWNFVFNSDASLLEGNRIQDLAPSGSPRFETVAVTQHFSALDQYLMGFRSPDEVEGDYTYGMFLVTDPKPNLRSHQPQVDISFDGEREDVEIEDIIRAEGRRTPDSTVSQRHFRFAFILVVPKGQQPNPDDLAQLDSYRAAFESYFPAAADNRATADTALRRSLALSVFPAAGVVAGQSIPATVSVAAAPASPLEITFSVRTGNISLPASVTIPARATSAAFQIAAVQRGTDTLTAVPSDSSYDSALANIQVNPTSALKIAAVSGDRQTAPNSGPLPAPVVVQLTDINNLPYAGARVIATPGTGGAVTPGAAVTDAAGTASFVWTPGSSRGGELRFMLDVDPNVNFTATAVTGLVTAAAVLNAASYTRDVAPGSLAALYGANLAAGATATADGTWPTTLAGVQVFVDGSPAQLLYVSDTQINLVMPQSLMGGISQVRVSNPRGNSSPLSVMVSAVAPGIFFDPATNYGAILNTLTYNTTLQEPARAGDYLAIYCTGLGSVSGPDRYNLVSTAVTPTVAIGGLPAEVSFSGLAPGFTALYQVNAQVPAGLASGAQPLTLSIAGATSNTVLVGIQ